MEQFLWAVPQLVPWHWLAFIKSQWINKQDAGNETMTTIAKNIAEGAIAFLKAEYQKLAIFVIVVAGLLAYANNGKADSHALIAVSFIVGAVCSVSPASSACASPAAVRTANAARRGSPPVDVAFSGGAVMGMSVVGLALFGLGLLFFMFGRVASRSTPTCPPLRVEPGFERHHGLAWGQFHRLFARVGGGIFTKAADVGADLVGKVEAGIPEDDPRNPNHRR